MMNQVQWNKNCRVLMVGLGLIGGSYAAALSDQGFCVKAIDKDPGAICYAMEQGIIKGGSTVPDARLLGEADVVIAALYPHVFLSFVKENQAKFKQGAILTDVTGVKGSLVYEVQEMLRPDVEFIAAHPMAGREVSGVQNSSKDLFRGANYIVVPTKQNTVETINFCCAIGETVGAARVSVLSPEEHDEMIGFVSQLTHCIAISLMTCCDNRHLVEYTGDSFRDLTRIARINDAMWSELFLLNREALLRQMDLFADEFARLHELLRTGDGEGLREKMRLSTARRALFDVN